MRSAVLTALVIATALFMENIDGTVISTSLPAIALDLRQDPIILKLAFTSYLLTLAVFIPVHGWFADRFGSRTVFAPRSSFSRSARSSAAPRLRLRPLAARAFQGLGGAMMVPVGRLMILRTVPKSDLVRALTYLTMPALIGPVSVRCSAASSPPISTGAGSSGSMCRSAFSGCCSRSVHRNLREQAVPRFDFMGFVLSGVGLSTLVSGLSMIRRGIFALAGRGDDRDRRALIGLYVRHANGKPDAILDLKLLTIPTFSPASSADFFFRTGVGAMPFVLPMMLQVGFGLTPFASGSLTFATAAGAL